MDLRSQAVEICSTLKQLRCRYALFGPKPLNMPCNALWSLQQAHLASTFPLELNRGLLGQSLQTSIWRDAFCNPKSMLCTALKKLQALPGSAGLGRALPTGHSCGTLRTSCILIQAICTWLFLAPPHLIYTSIIRPSVYHCTTSPNVQPTKFNWAAQMGTSENDVLLGRFLDASHTVLATQIFASSWILFE